MNLKTLLASLQKYEAYGSLDIDIAGLSYDSRKVRNGDLFAALPGHIFHGSRFLSEAQQSGAVAVLSDRRLSTPLPHIVVSNARLALALLSSSFYSHPSGKLKLLGVTGTNGKTTTTFLLRSILEHASIRCGLLGTVQYSSAASSTASVLTTPESLDLQRLLASMVSEDCSACVMEVSSHSLVQHRVAGCLFESSIFTNLTQDHLDYHHNMEEYFQAKLMLFSNRTCKMKRAILNIDDPYGCRIASMGPCPGQEFFSYGFKAEADFSITGWQSEPGGSEIRIRRYENTVQLRTPLIGRYNAYNVCAAFAAMNLTGIHPQAITAGIENMKQVPGRLERIDNGQPFLIFIDYAHTEDAIRQLLATVRSYTQKRLIVLFGCGGERDRGKRPLMGKAAAELADIVILSSDNPRTEDPFQILQEILAGVELSENKNVHVITDRKEAIAFAVQIAQQGDSLVLAGKGHENYQIIGNEKLHFDEREILRDLLK